MPRAAIIPKPNSPVEVRDLPPAPMEPGSVLLKTIYSEVCGTDVHLQKGRLTGVPYPLLPGHVAVGEVAETDRSARDVLGAEVQVGDVVTYLDVHETCNHCWYCLVAQQTTRCPARKVYGITYGADDGLLGGWCENIYLKPGVKILRLPHNVSAKRLMAAGCAMPTSIHAIDRAEIRLADCVAVQGAGPVGLCCAWLAKQSGAGRVIAIDSRPHRLQMARQLAADDVVAFAPEKASDVVEQVRDLTDGRGADVTIEATGSPRAVPDGMRMTRDGGRYVVVGHYTDGGEVSINPHTDINRRHLEIRGSWGSDFSHFYRMVQLLAQLDAARGAALDALITHEFGLDQMNDALAAVENGDAVKAIVDPSS